MFEVNGANTSSFRDMGHSSSMKLDGKTPAGYIVLCAAKKSNAPKTATKQCNHHEQKRIYFQIVGLGVDRLRRAWFRRNRPNQFRFAAHADKMDRIAMGTLLFRYRFKQTKPRNWPPSKMNSRCSMCRSIIATVWH